MRAALSVDGEERNLLWDSAVNSKDLFLACKMECMCGVGAQYNVIAIIIITNISAYGLVNTVLRKHFIHLWSHLILITIF